jgi:hypothetical protein
VLKLASIFELFMAAIIQSFPSSKIL